MEDDEKDQARTWEATLFMSFEDESLEEGEVMLQTNLH